MVRASRDRTLTLFEAALEIRPDERRSWVESACGSDVALRDDVLSLLEAHEMTGILDEPLLRLPADEDEGLQLDTKIGPYRLIKELGRGGMGIVYLADDDRLQRSVALKILPRHLLFGDAAREQLLAEARAASLLDHPNICTIFDLVETDDGQLCMVMVYCRDSLATRLKQGPLSIGETIRISMEIAAGLKRAHEVGLVHRDIKPSNIGLAQDGTPKILDFGLAALVGSDASAGRQGTLPYMAPEQAMGRQVDARADLWSLGAVIYEMLTAERAFRSPSEPLIRWSAVPEKLRPILQRLFESDPESRYRNADEVIRDLQAVPPSRWKLPSFLTSFVGRETECDRLKSLLGAARLVTLTGPAGAGKTRLACEVARTVANQLMHGVVFVPLASLVAGELVPGAILAELEVDGVRATRGVSEIASVIGDTPTILLLDNFEHVTSAALLLLDLLQRCPNLRLLVTSRVALRLSGEHEFPVAPLGGRAAAVQLFTDRARAVRPGFEPAAAVVDICERLDGLPLAIELAAARINVLSPEAILSRLNKRLDLLGSGHRDRPSRHQTLRHAIDWSYSLLGSSEKKLFRCCGVFNGGFVLEALEALGPAAGIPSHQVLDSLSTLVDHSLVVHRDGRFSMLETIREFAMEALQARGEVAAVREAQAQFYLQLAEEAEKHLTGKTQAHWTRRLNTEHDNIRAVLDWLVDTGRAEIALRICAAIWRFWFTRGHFEEGQKRIVRALRQAGEHGPVETRVRALVGCSTLAYGVCDMSSAARYAGEAVGLSRDCVDSGDLATALNNLAWILVETNRLDEADRLTREALPLHEQCGNVRGVAVALNNLGWIAQYRGDHQTAKEFHTRALALRRQISDSRGVVFALINIAWSEIAAGAFQSAAAHLDEARVEADEIDDLLLQAWLRQNAAQLALEKRDYTTALNEAAACQSIWQDLNHPIGRAQAGIVRSLAFMELGELSEASRALEESAERVRMMAQPWALAWLEYAEARLQVALNRDAEEPARRALERFRSIGNERGVRMVEELIARAG
jgi:non-specific serine/threonine protein kinase